MKTKLLLFMALFSSAVSFSQFDIAESYETEFPSSWTTSGQTTGFSRVSNATYACDGTYVMQANLSGANAYAQIITSDYISSGMSITTSFKYTAFYNSSNPAVGAVYFYYSVNNGAYALLDSRTSFGNCGSNVLQATIPAASVPSGSLVKFRMQINSTNSTIFFDDFKANQASVTAIAEYNFNNTYNNINGNTPFSSNGGTSFVLGRDGVTANGAININNTGTFATIPGLSYGATARTISVWAKFNSIQSGFNFIYHYGTNGSGNGLFVNPTTITHFPMSPNHSVAATTVIDTWYHYVIVYDGVNSKIYRNGTLLNSTPKTLNTGTNSNIFRLGLTETGAQGNFHGQLDDLKIYGSALSDAQVSNLYNYNSLLVNASISSINSTSITTNSASINYSLNANNTTATSIVKYGLTSGNLTSSATGFTATGNTITPGTVSITGLLPNTQYFYTVEATNSNGTETSTESSFTTLANPMSTIAEYNFDNTYNNILGSRPFTANTGTSFTQDRAGNANSALNLVSIGTTATIPNLPYNSDSRTISVWVKNYTYNWFVASACPFSYGTNSNTYELYMAQSGMTVNPYSPYSNQHSVDLTALSITNALNTWNHYAVSYNGTTSKIYKDGVLLSTLNIAITPTTNNLDIFKLGLLNSFTSQYFDGAIDDLKIYNYALSDAEVTNLFNNNTLTSQNFNQNNLEVTLYPNPANDVLNIEMTNEVQLVEIYNIQGQKVVTSNQKQINVSDLSSGMYMVKVQDSENAIATKKVIIK